MIKDLKSHHFNMGKMSQLPVRTNEVYGLGVQSAKKPQKEPWATLKTNFELGNDRMNKTTDYANRFMPTRSLSIGCSPNDEAKKNKSKM